MDGAKINIYSSTPIDEQSPMKKNIIPAPPDTKPLDVSRLGKKPFVANQAQELRAPQVAWTPKNKARGVSKAVFNDDQDEPMYEKHPNVP